MDFTNPSSSIVTATEIGGLVLKAKNASTIKKSFVNGLQMKGVTIGGGIAAQLFNATLSDVWANVKIPIHKNKCTNIYI